MSSQDRPISRNQNFPINMCSLEKLLGTLSMQGCLEIHNLSSQARHPLCSENSKPCQRVQVPQGDRVITSSRRSADGNGKNSSPKTL